MEKLKARSASLSFIIFHLYLAKRRFALGLGEALDITKKESKWTLFLLCSFLFMLLLQLSSLK